MRKSVGSGTSGSHCATRRKIKHKRGAGCPCENCRKKEPEFDKTLLGT